MKIYSSFTIVFCFCLSFPTFAQDSSNSVPMRDKGAATYYIDGHISGFGNTEFMVDTGSGYTTINENTLKILSANGNATYLKKLKGILADGTEKIVSVYRISTLKIGNKCELHDVEAAILPGDTRHILGLNTLKKTGSFTFSFEPPTLTLDACHQT